MHNHACVCACLQVHTPTSSQGQREREREQCTMASSLHQKRTDTARALRDEVSKHFRVLTEQVQRLLQELQVSGEGPSLREKGLLDGALLGTGLVDRCSKLLQVVRTLREQHLLHHCRRVARAVRQGRTQVRGQRHCARQRVQQVQQQVQQWVGVLQQQLQ